MPYTYLLDTNIISDLVRHPTGQIFQRLSSVGETNVRKFSRVPKLLIENWL